jgi:cob(I)alamin adenosyltransferase
MHGCPGRNLTNIHTAENSKLKDQEKPAQAGKQSGTVRIIGSTRKGDRGETTLLSGEKVSKASLRLEAGGNLDESNAAMGLAKSLTKNDKIRDIITRVQEDLILLGSELSSTNPRQAKRIEADHISQLEHWIEELQIEVPLSPHFVHPGANTVSAALDLARSVVRRTERSMVSLKEAGNLNREEGLTYINRLACLLFTLARYAEKSQQV